MNKQLVEKLLKKISDAKGDPQLLVDAPFSFIEIVMLDVGAIVLLCENTKTNSLDRIALSRTEPAAGAVRASNKPFHEIKIPMNDNRNALIKAITSGKQQTVTDWKYLFVPALTAQEARDNQNGAGVMCSIVSPLSSDKNRGALIFSFLCTPNDITNEHQDFITTYTAAVSATL